jgi:hypothetical protein
MLKQPNESFGMNMRLMLAGIALPTGRQVPRLVRLFLYWKNVRNDATF